MQCCVSPGAGAVDPLVGRLQGRRPFSGEGEGFGQSDRKLLLWHGDWTARATVDDGNGRAPVTLPRDQPITELGADQVTTCIHLPGFLGNGVKGLFSAEACELHRGGEQDRGTHVNPSPTRMNHIYIK